MVDGFSTMLGDYMKKMQQAAGATDNLQKRVKMFAAAFAVGAAITGVGAAGADALLHMAKAAGQLQMSMKGVQDTMKCNPQKSWAA